MAEQFRCGAEFRWERETGSESVVGRRVHWVGRHVARGAAACVIVVAGVIAASAQEAAPRAPRRARLTDQEVRALREQPWEASATRVGQGPRIDGVMDDPAWQEAAPITGFLQREPDEGAPASQPTEVRIVYDDDALYFGFTCFDSEPEKVRATGMVRDGTMRADDYISVIIDTFHDHRTGFNFLANINGQRIDAVILGDDPSIGGGLGEARVGPRGSTRNRDWNGVFQSKGRKTEFGWELELEIPFKTLRFPARDVQTWGLIIKRVIPRNVEENFWPFIPRNGNPYWASLGGHLNELRGLRPGRSLELLPYVTSGVTRDVPASSTDALRDVGVDLKWGVTPNLTADFTVNTDFAQVESDQAQVNLTRFSLFFPEKRPFFLEGARLFDFGLQRTAQVFFSRRIGLTDDGAEVPILGGARLSGKNGRYGLAFMNMQTREALTADGQREPAGNFTVARVSRDLFARSRVGVIVTNKEVADRTYANRAAGIDADFIVLRSLFLSGFLAKTATTGAVGPEWGGFGQAAWNTDVLGVTGSYLDLDEEFNPEIGFVRRRGIRQSTGQLRWSPRRSSQALIKQYHLVGNVDYLTDQANRLQTRLLTGELTTNFRTGDNVTLKVERTFEHLDEAFSLRRDAEIERGTYRFSATEINFESFVGRPWRLDLRAGTGTFWSGHRQMIGAGSTWQTIHWIFDVDAERNILELPSIRYNSDVVNASVTYNVSADFSIRALGRWSSDQQRFSTNLRLNWIYRPGSDLYVVYSEVDEGRFSALVPRNRQLLIKLSYLLNY